MHFRGTRFVLALDRVRRRDQGSIDQGSSLEDEASAPQQCVDGIEQLRKEIEFSQAVVEPQDDALVRLAPVLTQLHELTLSPGVSKKASSITESDGLLHEMHTQHGPEATQRAPHAVFRIVRGDDGYPFCRQHHHVHLPQKIALAWFLVTDKLLKYWFDHLSPKTPTAQIELQAIF